MKSIVYISLLLTFLGCKTNRNDVLTTQDTIKIMSVILNGRAFLKENSNVDTLFFLRNKLFNKSWLEAKSRFKIKSLEDNSQTRMTNIGPGFPSDRRQRLSISKFEYKNDTAEIVMYEHGGHLYYETELNLKKGNWIILKQQAFSGGRIEKFEFEDEEWYKDLKKKVKPHQPMFPPAEPK